MRNRDLWERISAHPLPADAAGRSFADQLMQEHEISQTTAARGILEYRRFLYLSALGEGRSVPSRAVDAVWHLHLTHTRDYWDVFVPEVLGGRAIHHQPGSPDGHAGDFDATLARYEREFGVKPPKGIWKRRNRVAASIAATGMGLVTIYWVLAALGQGEPLAALFALAIGGFMTWGFLGGAVPSLEIGVDIFADGNGGDCGDCGGGCGD